VSVLLVGLDAELAQTVTRRLISQDDEVRVIATAGDDAGALRDLGAHVARGQRLDADLVERAAQNVRSIVVGAVEPETMSEILEGARFARVERIIVCSDQPQPSSVDLLREAPIQYVVLNYRKPGRFRRRSTHTDDYVALAIDTADDLAGEPRLELDLGAPSSAEALGLDPRSDPAN
jgi:hypothetical protein